LLLKQCLNIFKRSKTNICLNIIKRRDTYDLYISFYEIYGGRLYDLLNNKNKLSVLEDKKQKVQIFGLEEKQANSAEEMKEIIEEANSIRTTHNTVTNETSSRSHAVCNVQLFFTIYFIRLYCEIRITKQDSES